MKSIFVALVLLLLISVPVFANDNIHGELWVKYDLDQKSFGDVPDSVAGGCQEWGIDVYYSFTDWFDFGFTEVTFTNGYSTMFEMLPVYSNRAQLYEVYARFNLPGDISIKLSQWCNHPVVIGHNYDLDDRWSIYGGLYIEAKITF